MPLTSCECRSEVDCTVLCARTYTCIMSPHKCKARWKCSGYRDHKNQACCGDAESALLLRDLLLFTVRILPRATVFVLFLATPVLGVYTLRFSILLLPKDLLCCFNCPLLDREKGMVVKEGKSSHPYLVFCQLVSLAKYM